MAHIITAIIGKSASETITGDAYKLPSFALRQGFTMIGLNDGHCKYWSSQFNPEVLPQLKGSKTTVSLDLPIVHYWANEFFGQRYALIETEYFGGVGTQSASLYDSLEVVVSSEGDGSINQILKALGVRRTCFRDHFACLELEKYRHFRDHFSRYDK